MRALNALVAVLVSVVVTMTLVSNASASEMVPVLKPVLSARIQCGDSVQAFRRTGQPIDKWLVRITGPDLIRTIGSPLRGEAEISIEDAGGRRNFAKPFDQHSPLNTYVYMNGDTATITVSVNATPPNGNGCDTKMVLKHL